MYVGFGGKWRTKKKDSFNLAGEVNGGGGDILVDVYLCWLDGGWRQNTLFTPSYYTLIVLNYSGINSNSSFGW